MHALLAGKTSNSIEVLKQLDCQHRVLGGPPGLLHNCRLYQLTGKVNKDQAYVLAAYYGNTSITSSTRTIAVGNYPSFSSEVRAFGWEGFSSFSYPYRSRRAGLHWRGLDTLTVFLGDYLMNLELTQDSLSATEQTTSFGQPWQVVRNATSAQNSIPLRKYVESKSGWDSGWNTAYPRDSYGMPYSIPTGTVSVEDFAGYPAFASTAQLYGNKEWGGLEYTLLPGLSPESDLHQSFVEVDWVSGRIMRSALRPQILVRVERSSAMPNLIGAQSRCVSPTKSFLDGSGYGCFVYIPVVWYEDQRTIEEALFVSYHDHFYRRPGAC
jgi:hypothetical protein